MSRVVGVAVAALCGLVIVGVAWIRLRRWRRFTVGRQTVLATVVAAGPGELLLRWSTGDAGPVEVTVDVGTQVATQWRTRLEQGPPPVEEPDFEDRDGWDTVAVWYDPDGSPAAMLAQQVEAAKMAPAVLLTLGVLTFVFSLLAAIPSVLLGTLGLAQATVAGLFGATAISTLRRALRLPPPRGWRPILVEAATCGFVALFLGVGATAAIVAASI